MTRSLVAHGRFALAALLALTPACSALVSPDTARLGDDAGMVSQHDSSVPGDDAWSPPGTDSGQPPLDSGSPPLDDAWVPPGNDAGLPCPVGQVLCGTQCFLLASDPNHCGHCSVACNPGATCVSGVCTGGTPTSPLGNPNDCGPTHATCGQLQVCFDNQCVCRPPYQDVGGQCIDLQTDPQNCGSVGVDCGGGSCIGGNCVPQCPFMTGIRDCNGACVNVRNDPGNCGSCGNVCTGSEVCALGGCHAATVPPTCNSCPCAACTGGACCHWSSFNVTVCVAGLTTCG